MSLRLGGALLVVAILLFVLTRTAVHYAFLAIAAYSYPLIDPVDLRVYIPRSNETVTRLLLQSTAGEINLTPGATEILSGTARYNVAEFAPIIEIDVAGDRSQVLMHPREDLDVKRLINPGERINRWDMQIGTSIPYQSLAVNIGAGKFSADLAGVTAKQIELFIGTGEMALSVAGDPLTRGPLLADQLSAFVGTGSINLDLRNSEILSLTVEVGLGDTTLDLRTNWPEDSHVMVMNGMGSAQLVLPEEIAVEVHVINGVGATNASEFVRLGEAEDDSGIIYVNRTYSGNPARLNIVVDNGVGSVDLLTRPPE